MNPKDIISLHDNRIPSWEAKTIEPHEEGFLKLVEENHAFNYQLWHAEDRARCDDKGHAFVYLAKREIDVCNQARNNRMEAMDNWLFKSLNPSTEAACPVHSETPGMMIDRLSILSLKNYYMGLQLDRVDVDENHLLLCRQKSSLIKQQRQQLFHCLEHFLAEIIAKTRTFRIYHQFKMYNDPNLNPQLYAVAKT